MQITCLEVGPLSTNCYLLEKENKVLIIDPGDEFLKIKNAISNKEVVGCLVTHYHFDHIGALPLILKEYNIKENDYHGNLFDLAILDTKGHTKDSKTFYFKKEKIMFCGDFIFYHSIGRTDLGGSDEDMKESLNYIRKYSDDIKIYPGHGKETTLGEEKKRFSMYY